MLDYLERQYCIETLAGIGNRLSGCDPVVNLETGHVCVRLRCSDCLGPRIDAGHGKSETRHRLSREAPATPDVEQGQSGERPQRVGIALEMLQQPGADEVEPREIEAMQCAETAFGVPPGIGLRGKTPDLLIVDGGAATKHGSIPPTNSSARWPDHRERSM